MYVRNQIEYYFSDENLENDIYLRGQMDPFGYVPLSLIGSFNRVKSLTQDFGLLVSAASTSQLLEMSAEYMIRRRDNPEKWPLVTATTTSMLHVPQSLSQYNLNPDVPEFVPRFVSQSHTCPNLNENASASIAIEAKTPQLERLLSSSLPEKESHEWLQVCT